MRNYIDLTTIFSADTFGEYMILNEPKKIFASDQIKNFYSVTNEFENFSDVYLFKNNKVVMCSIEFELLTNKPFIDNAKGDILILGLGLGMIVFPLLNDPLVTSIKIIENDDLLIQYIGGKISEYDTDNKVSIVSGDAYEYFTNMNQNEKYDTIYLDFWIELNNENIEEVTSVKENYRNFLKDENSIILSWCEDIKHLLIAPF